MAVMDLNRLILRRMTRAGPNPPHREQVSSTHPKVIYLRIFEKSRIPKVEIKHKNRQSEFKLVTILGFVNCLVPESFCRVPLAI